MTGASERSDSHSVFRVSHSDTGLAQKLKGVFDIDFVRGLG